MLNFLSLAYILEEYWGKNCDEGHRQSPIDLSQEAAVKGHFSPFAFDGYDDSIINASITNTGHSLQVKVGHKNNLLLMGGGLPGVYRFDHLHFHWGSEHTIQGMRYALELHMVHVNERFNSITEAIKSDENGLAVLGVLFHASESKNPIIDKILLGSERIRDDVGKQELLHHAIELEDLLPRDKSSYFRYQGSLTTPDCGESVLWTVFRESLEVSLDQIERFKTIHSDHGHELTHNFRSLKPLNTRTLILVINNNTEVSKGSSFNTKSYLTVTLSVICYYML